MIGNSLLNTLLKLGYSYLVSLRLYDFSDMLQTKKIDFLKLI